MYSDAFTTIHKHLLFMSPYCRTTFRLLVHVCLLQYSRSSNVLALRRTLVHIFTTYPRISSSWTQWVKNNNRQNCSQELKRVLAWQNSHYSNSPWSFFFFMGNLVAHDVKASLFYFLFFIHFFLNLKVLCVNAMEGNAQV